MRKDITSVNIWSFGDLITNSSSEVYCLYNTSGKNQIYESIKEIVHCLKPDINIDDHLDISIQINEDHELWDNDCEITVKEYYDKEFGKWAENKSNEYVLSHLDKFHNKLINKLAQDYNDYPGTLTLSIEAKTELGKILRKGIFGILYAFNYEEIYT